jgi:DNA polymerase (family 10)
LLPEIPAEMRDGILEEEYLDLLKNNSSEMLKPGFDISNVIIKESDLKGIIHNHSTYSDGIHSIEEMANAALKLGFQYIGISDHSKSAFYAGGLKEDSIKKQHEEIDILNEKLTPFKILKGIESDILKDGSLDYKDSVLESFDFIISSIHNRFNQNKTDMTKRICRAIENPYTTILGHVSGRLLLQRSEYEMDIEKILETASTNNKSIEFNSNPKRLDLSWRNLLKAQKANIKICISPDAHSTEQLKYFKYGVQFLRKAGLTPEKVLNTLGADQFLAYSSK